MPGFWSSDNPVIQPTPGDQLPPPQNNPFDHILGVQDGLDPVNQAGAQAVHPALSPDPDSPDSLIAKAGKPAHFDDRPDVLSPSVFALWHTAYQQEYINRHRPEADPRNGILTIGDQIHVTLSATQDKVYILEMLQKADFATMALDDQTRIAAVPDFFDPIARKFGLSAGPSALNALNALLQTTEDEIDPDPNAPPSDPPANASFVTHNDRQVFVDQLTNIRTQLAGMGVFSAADINAAIKAIKERFDRVAVFAKAKATPETPPLDAPTDDENPKADFKIQFHNVVSGDGGAAIARGFDAFMNAERQILAADNAAMQIAATGTLTGLTRHLDAPGLLVAFQLSANLKDQSINAGDTEEINQINELLKTYNMIQELINQTIAAFDAAHNDQRRGLLGYDHDGEQQQNRNNSGEHEGHISLDHLMFGPGDLHDQDALNPPHLTQEQVKVVSMFENGLNGIASPIEELLGVKRPTLFDFYDNKGFTLNYFEKSTWDQWSATLGNTVQQISQQNQLKFNDINTLEKERTAHFQAASNALAKAAELASTVGRNIA